MDLAKEDTMGGWITLTRYCKVTGDSRQAVHLRVRSGKWQRGTHLTVPDGGSAWVNVPAVMQWIREGLMTPADETQAIPFEQALKEGSESPSVMVEAVTVTLKPTYKTYIPELMQDEDLPRRYANLTGMDLGGTVLGPLTGIPSRARQFDKLPDCIAWCDANQELSFFPIEVELEYV